MYELFYDGRLIGVFSSENAAHDFMNKNYPTQSYSIYPFGTTLNSDML